MIPKNKINQRVGRFIDYTGREISNYETTWKEDEKDNRFVKNYLRGFKEGLIFLKVIGEVELATETWIDVIGISKIFQWSTAIIPYVVLLYVAIQAFRTKWNSFKDKKKDLINSAE